MPDIVDESKVISEIFLTIFKAGFKGSTDWFGRKSKEHDFFGLAAKRYTDKLKERYNIIRVLGTDKPVSLRDIYVRVNILEKITARQRISVGDLEKQFDRDRRGFGTKIKTITGIEAADQLKKFIVLGKPGAGKTTYLKYLALQNLDTKTKRGYIPVFISLKEFSDSDSSLLDFIVKQFDICRFPQAESFILRILEKGNCQVLLDGIDEIKDKKKDKTIQQLRDFSYKYSDNQIILSCRIAYYGHWFDEFVDVEIADFNDEQVRVFVNNWFKNKPDIAKVCWQEIKNTPQIKELATIPLLLALLCLVFQDLMNFPTGRADLYKEALDIVLKVWDGRKRVKRSELYKNLSLQHKKAMFACIAAETYERGEYFLPQRILEKSVSEFIERLRDVNIEGLQVDGQSILKSIEVQHGLFVERAKGIYSFSHLSFQEYFTAKYIASNTKHRTLDKLIESHLDNYGWREVFLLTAEIVDKTDDFLLLMQKKIKNLQQEWNVNKLLEVTQDISKKKSKLAIAPTRILVLLQLIVLYHPYGPRDDPFEMREFNHHLSCLKVFFKISFELLRALDSGLMHKLIYDLKKNIEKDCSGLQGEYISQIKDVFDSGNVSDIIYRLSRAVSWNRLGFLGFHGDEKRDDFESSIVEKILIDTLSNTLGFSFGVDDITSPTDDLYRPWFHGVRFLETTVGHQYLDVCGLLINCLNVGYCVSDHVRLKIFNELLK